MLPKKFTLRCGRTGDAQRLLRIDEEAPLKDQKIVLLEQRVSNLEREDDLLKQQNAIQEKLTELAKREAEVYRIAFEKEKELTYRALKLAEVRKPNRIGSYRGYWDWPFCLRIFSRERRWSHMPKHILQKVLLRLEMAILRLKSASFFQKVTHKIKSSPWSDPMP